MGRLPEKPRDRRFKIESQIRLISDANFIMYHDQINVETIYHHVTYILYHSTHLNLHCKVGRVTLTMNCLSRGEETYNIDYWQSQHHMYSKEHITSNT